MNFFAGGASLLPAHDRLGFLGEDLGGGGLSVLIFCYLLCVFEKKQTLNLAKTHLPRSSEIIP